MREIQPWSAAVARQQAKMEKMQLDAVEDAKFAHDYLGQVHAMIRDD